MHLKSITLHGFKSFSNRTEIPLGQGITAIVGPNGCGKSNVSDAIRWILGEHNVRMIRGESILDVIFKGAGDVKPSGFAEVNLLIENEDKGLPLDQTEVSIARRVYRSGESNFLINNLPCRLKDIRNLFLGTGLGSHGYSVIERGMVDSVLSENDDQRRLFFEEAAGISRYKIQRKEALRKLEGVEQDLTRIDDIVREIEREVRSLARQVGKARKHQRLMDEIRDLEVDLALRQWRGLADEHSSTTAERDQRADHRTRLATELARRDADVEVRKSELLTRERALDQVRREREQLQNDQAASREEAAVLATKIQAWEQKDGELSRRIREESEREAGLRARIEEHKPERERLTTECARHQSLVDAATAAFQDAETVLRAARAEYARSAQLQMEQLVVQTKESKELESVDAMIQQLEGRRDLLAAHREGLLAKAEDLAGRCEGLSREISALDERLNGITRSREEIERERARLDAEREELRESREDVTRRRASVESRLNLLREQRARHEGFADGVRHLLERRDALPGFRGVVGDLLTPAAGLDEKVAEALLGECVQWVLVDDEDAAWALLDALREAGLGGVTFFPLKENAGRASAAPSTWTESPLDGPPELAVLVDFLVSRVQRSESRKEAREQVRAGPPFLRSLSPEGDLLAAEGWIRMPGGRGPDAEILDRMREIPHLESVLAQVKDEEQEVRLRLAARDAASGDLLERGKALEEEGLDATERHRRSEREHSEYRVERGLILEEEERVAAEVRDLLGQIRSFSISRAALTGRIGDSDASGREADLKRERARALEEERGAARDRAFEDLSRARTELIQIEAALREVETSQGRDRAEADRLAAALIQWDEERVECARLRSESAEKRVSLLARGTEIESQLAEAERSLDRKRQERDSDTTLLAVAEQELKGLRGELGGIQDRLHSDSVREIEIRSEMERLRERILQEFGLDLSEIARTAGPTAPETAGPPDDALDDLMEEEEAEEPIVPTPDDAEARRARIVDLRRKLLSLGAVNFLAAEEYAKQKERLLFHRKQQEDLMKARADLLQVIQQINDTAGLLFRETFEAARGHFRTTFEFLFPGGEADITLTGEDPLEASIEIIARPRGKKLEAIRLLSTGERSLTAIALLFGIYLVKPSPFCILDELDAPLDDANIGRFVTLLRHFSERTQFVVITHNKRTMEASDRLYGVTMQELGISKLVSVKLTDAGAELAPVIGLEAPVAMDDGGGGV